MAATIIKERYYILTPLSFLLGALVLVATLLLAATSYLRSIDKTLAGYDHMLTSIDATLIHEMVLANRRQLGVLEASLDKQAIARGGSAINGIWAIAHQFKHDAHFLYFYNTRFDRFDSYPDWQMPTGYQVQKRPWYQTLASDGEELIWFGPYQEFGGNAEVLTLIKRVKDDEGQLLGLLMVDMSFNSLQAALRRAMGSDQAAIYITERKGGRLVVGHNLSLLPAVSGTPSQGAVLSVIREGCYLKQPLSDIDWDLNIYLPPAHFHDCLQDTLLMVVLPALALLGIWLCSLLFLVRIFRQEQTLVQRSLSGLVQDEALMEIQLRQRTWFVHGSLGEIHQVRNSLLQGQDALLHDPLTGIMNRRAFEQDRARLAQEDRPHWLVLFDVDCFKRVNDSWGHGVGDAVLFRVATIMARTLGEAQVYRIGGDEFAALLPWEREEVEDRLTRLLARVRALQWREFEESITLSAGGARYPDDAAALLDRADECLYQSKRQGRDCWHLSATSAPSKGAVVTVSV
ncbi:sensor domain-containing diguanylate cyclase [Aeromonas media]|uniref:sensor domain-containing diguanylate cyclase n=1 Tax=Aeromonas media TaxID=651 RepID=UPI001920EF51|nr:sensor domain-containing diguanylate cyclase [Aeromonas media]MBL0512956.1 diguanylate cyclase [Aeromonas media]